MADINQLIEPITPSNTVNSINIYKEDYSDFWNASASYLPNVFAVNKRKIKGKKYSNDYIITNPKIGQLKIKQFVSPILKSHWGLVSKAVKIKNTISLNTENDKYMFVLHASKEDLKKIKYDNYFGIRVSNTDLYDFDRRMIYHDIQRDPNNNDVVIIDRNNAEPMIDLSKYKNVFIDKNNFKPILRYYVDEYYDEDTPEFIGKQQDGATGSIILPDRSSENTSETIDNSVNNQDVNSEITSTNHNQEDSETLAPSYSETLAPSYSETLTQQSSYQQDVNSDITRTEDDELLFDERTGELIYPERKALYNEQSKVEKDLKKTIVRYVDKYVDFAAANELNNIEDIDYIINAFNEYAQDENIKINKRSIDAVNRRVDKLYDIISKLDSMPKIRRERWF